MYRDTDVIVLDGDLDPYRDGLKRQLERVHMILVDPFMVRCLKDLIHGACTGKVRLSNPTERFIWWKIQSRLGQHLKGKINPKRGRPKKRTRRKRLPRIPS
jgi:hypothetical protein